MRQRKKRGYIAQVHTRRETVASNTELKSEIKNKNIAIFGGSFDPPTISHIQVACEIYNCLDDIDEVWMIPCGDQRTDKKLKVEGKHRLKMLEMTKHDIIIDDLPILVKDTEIANQKYMPTYDLLTKLQKENPDDQFSFCLGSDIAKSLIKWDNGEKLMKEFQFIIINRPSYQIEKK